MSRLAVYVPTDEQLRDEIWKGSGIVGSPVGETERLRLDFEGSREVFEAYEERVQRAAERHLWDGGDGQQGYPTSAMAYVDPDAVVQVGWWQMEKEQLDITEPDLLSAWLDEGR